MPNDGERATEADEQAVPAVTERAASRSRTSVALISWPLPANRLAAVAARLELPDVVHDFPAVSARGPCRRSAA